MTKKKSCMPCVRDFLDEYTNLASGKATPSQIKKLSEKTSKLVEGMLNEAKKIQADPAKKRSQKQWSDVIEWYLTPVKQQCDLVKYADNMRLQATLCIEQFVHHSHESNHFLALACKCPLFKYGRGSKNLVGGVIQETFDYLADKHD